MNKKQIDNLENSILEKFREITKDIPSYVIKIGVFLDEDKNKRKKVEHKEPTNATIMFYMEYGAPLNNIPARPVLAKTIKYAEENLKAKFVGKGLQEYFYSGGNLDAYEKQLLIMCQKMESHVKRGIRHREFGLIPNKLSTIEKKGSDIPLLDTGQLANSVQCRLYRWGNEEVKIKKEETT